MAEPLDFDISDLGETLLDDTEGTLRVKIEAYLGECRRNLKQILDAGTDQATYAALQKLEGAISSCERVLNFLPALQKQRSSQS